MTAHAVADASVVAAVVFDEHGGETVADALREVRLHEPHLLLFELAHVAVTKARRHPARLQALLEALTVASALDCEWESIEHETVVRLALETGLSAYDATYLWLATALGAPLLTLDRRLDAAARRLGLA